MIRIGNPVPLILLFSVAVVLFVLLYSAQEPPSVNIPEMPEQSDDLFSPVIVEALGITPIYYRGRDMVVVAPEELVNDPSTVMHESGLLTMYQVDVFYNSSTIVTEGGSAAMNCLSKNGTMKLNNVQIKAYSQKGTRFIHLFCADGDRLFDITVAQLIKGPKWKNPWTQMISAQEILPGQNVSLADKYARLLRYLQAKWPGVEVNLYFSPGEIMFFTQ